MYDVGLHHANLLIRVLWSSVHNAVGTKRKITPAGRFREAFSDSTLSILILLFFLQMKTMTDCINESVASTPTDMRIAPNVKVYLI